MQGTMPVQRICEQDIARRSTEESAVGTLFLLTSCTYDRYAQQIDYFYEAHARLNLRGQLDNWVFSA